MKVTIGMRVQGEIDEGKVIAMTNEWCIYELDRPVGGEKEVAEPWRSIQIVAEKPGEVVSPISEKEI